MSRFAREAGFVNDPNDPGGATNFGITIAVLAAWRHAHVTVSDVQSLKRSEAASIYRSHYWDAAFCGHLPDGVDLITFDAAVNMGVEPALNLLRAQSGLAVSRKTHHHPKHPAHPGKAQQAAAEARLDAAAQAMCIPSVIEGLAERRRHFYRSLKTFSHFGKGWLDRVEKAQHLAMHLWSIGGTGIPHTAGLKLSHHPRHKAATR